MRSVFSILAMAAACLGVATCAPVSTRVPPPDDAAPQVVARAYLDALVAGDCTATRALLAHDDNPAMSDLCGIGRADGYRGLTEPAGTATDVSLGVTLALRDMPRMSGWPDGDATVFLHLVREAGGPWRVSGVGSGP